MHLCEPGPDAPFFIVLNAGSGHQETELRCATIRSVLEQAGRDCHLALVHDPEMLAETATRMTAKARDAGGIVVAAGGDGTINAVAREALLTGCPFGVLPQGTFNYFGRTHGIPEELDEAARVLLGAQVRRVQLGLVNDRIFLVNASVGLYPKLIEEREQATRQFGRGRLVALYSAFKTAFRPYRLLRITLESDGRPKHLRTPTLFVGNNRLQMEQVGMTDLTDAVEDGQLVAIAPRPVGKLGLLGLLLRGMAGRLGGAPNLVAFAFRRLVVGKGTLYGRRSVKVAIDGEIVRLPLPLEFRVLQGHLSLLVPPASGVAPPADHLPG